MADDLERATREKVVLALIPVASRHSLSNPQEIVDIATVLCKYVGALQEPEPTATGKSTGTTLTSRGPKGK